MVHGVSHIILPSSR